MRKLIILTLFTALTSACLETRGPDASADGTITIENASSYTITEVRVTPVNSRSWGPNLLGRSLRPDALLIVSVACDTYDVLIADERDRSCTLSAIDVCASDERWFIDNGTRRSCDF